MSFGKLLERLLHLVPVLLGVSVIVFLMITLTPGDPVEIMLGDQKVTPEQEAARPRTGAGSGACATTSARPARPAAADRHRPGADPEARLRGLRRAGLGARRLDPGADHPALARGAPRSAAGSTPSAASPSARRRPHATSCVASPGALPSPKTSCSPTCIWVSSPISRPRTAARPGRSHAPRTGRSWSRTAISGASTRSCSGSFTIAIQPGVGASCCAWARSAAPATTRAA